MTNLASGEYRTFKQPSLNLLSISTAKELGIVMPPTWLWVRLPLWIASDYQNNQKLIDMEDAATVLLDLIRIREVRHQMLATVDLATATPKQLQ